MSGGTHTQLEENFLEQQVAAMMGRIFSREASRTHEDIQRDIRQDNFEHGKMLREVRQAARASGVASDPSSQLSKRGPVIIHAVTTLIGFESISTVRNRTPYRELHGLRCLMRAACSSLDAADSSAALSADALVESREHFDPAPQLRHALRVLRDLRQEIGDAAVDEDQLKGSDDVGIGLPSVAWDSAGDMLAAVSDVWLVGHSLQDVVAQLHWKRSLHHAAHTCRFDRYWSPQILPPAMCGLSTSSYVAVVAVALATAAHKGPSHTAVPFTPFEQLVLRSGMNRTKHLVGPPWIDTEATPAAPLVGPRTSALSKSSSSGKQLRSPSHFLLLIDGRVFTVPLAIPAALKDEGHSIELTLPVADIATSVREAFRQAQRASQSTSFLGVSAVSSDELVTSAGDSHRDATAAVLQEVLQVDHHERLVHLLDTARFVISLDTVGSGKSDFTAMLAAHAVRETTTTAPWDPASTMTGMYPFASRWLNNALHVSIDVHGRLELTCPNFLGVAQAYTPHRPFGERLMRHVCAVVAAHDEVHYHHSSSATITPNHLVTLPSEFVIRRCVWATGLIFQLLSVTPGQVLLCLLVEQLVQFAQEVLKILTNDDDRDAVDVAISGFRDMCAAPPMPTSIALLSAFLAALRPHFIIITHPSISTPATVVTQDAAHQALLVRAVLNPYLARLERQEGSHHTPMQVSDASEEMSSQTDDNDGNASDAMDLLMETLAWSPPGPFKVSLLFQRQMAMESRAASAKDKSSASAYLGVLAEPTLHERTVESIDFFTSIPSKQERLKMVQAAGSVGFHVARLRDAVAHAHEAASKSFKRLMYVADDAVLRGNPWRPAVDRVHVAVDVVAPSTATALVPFDDICVLSSETLFRLSRNVSRFVMNAEPYAEDDCITLRFAHPDAVAHALIAIAVQLAACHMHLPVQPRQYHENKHRLLQTLTQSWNTVGEPLLVAGEMVPADQLVSLYYGYVMPHLCLAPKTATMLPQQAIVVTASALFRAALHHYRPVIDPLHIQWVGVVQRSIPSSPPPFPDTDTDSAHRRPSASLSVGTPTIAVESQSTARTLQRRYPIGDDGSVTVEYRSGTQQMISALGCHSASTTLDLVDCASRCATSAAGQTPCALALLNSNRCGAALRAPPIILTAALTEVLSLRTGEDSELHVKEAARRQRLQRFTAGYAAPSSSSESQPAGRTALCVHLLRMRHTRLIDGHVTECTAVDLRGVCANPTEGAAWVALVPRCVDVLLKLWDALL